MIYLLTLCTVIVSHDSGFLNNTITDVLHLNRFKIRRYRGNLEAFVKQVPEAKSYYTLEAAEDYKFKLPAPPLLEGVKTKEKSLLKMRKVGFQYPSQPIQQLYDITLQVSLSSRVAILGPNGSGKSTLVKLLTGETEPNKGGEIWKHPNLVIGYVAQHAFHHIDHHLDKTPLEYMLWRYQTGEDLEEMSKATRQISEVEAQKMKDGALYIHEGQKRLIDEIIARKKLKQSYEYEVSFKALSSSENLWIPRDELVKRGFEKASSPLFIIWRDSKTSPFHRKSWRSTHVKPNALVCFDLSFVMRLRSTSLTLDWRPSSCLTTPCAACLVGRRLRSSLVPRHGVVLISSVWMSLPVCSLVLRQKHGPLILCADYLDRESLAALIEALKVFDGGVLVITHNRDFSESLCSE